MPGKPKKHSASKKRSRNSSSDAEDKVTQDRKRDRLMDTKSKAAEDSHVMEPVQEAGVSDALNAKLSAIIAGQDQLRKDINTNFIKQSQQLSAMIDAKLAGLRAEIDEKLQVIYDDLRQAKERLCALELRIDGTHAPADYTQLEDLRHRLDAMETGATDDAGRSRDLTLIIKGLSEENDGAGEETMEVLIQKCQQLLAQLQITAADISARRLGTPGQGRTPRPIAMTLSSLDEVKQIMRHKRQLKDAPAYSRVYIEPDRPREIRSLEANIRRLAREHPTLQMRRGRLVEKPAAETQNPTNDA